MKEEEEEGDSGKRRREGDRKEGRKEIKRYRKGSKTSPWKSEIIGLKIVKSGSKTVELAVLKRFTILSKFYKSSSKLFQSSNARQLEVM